MPDGPYAFGENVAKTIIRVKTEETTFLNPLAMTEIVRKVAEAKGAPGAILFTSSSSGIESASYLAGALDLPLITDVSGFDAERGVFLKSYYSDKIFGEFKPRKAASSLP